MKQLLRVSEKNVGKPGFGRENLCFFLMFFLVGKKWFDSTR